MLQLRSGLYLRKKTLGPECSSEIGVQDFDRYVAIVAEVVCEVDCCHAAGADLAIKPVFGVERGGKTAEDVSHRTLFARELAYQLIQEIEPLIERFDSQLFVASVSVVFAGNGEKSADAVCGNSVCAEISAIGSAGLH